MYSRDRDSAHTANEGTEARAGYHARRPEIESPPCKVKQAGFAERRRMTAKDHGRTTGAITVCLARSASSTKTPGAVKAAAISSQ